MPSPFLNTGINGGSLCEKYELVKGGIGSFNLETSVEHRICAEK